MSVVMADEASDDIRADSTVSAWVLLDRIEKYPKQAALAAEIGVDPSVLSEFKNNKGAIKISTFKALLKALNLKLVSADARCVNPVMFEQLTQLCGKCLKEQPQLLWEDNEQ